MERAGMRKEEESRSTPRLCVWQLCRYRCSALQWGHRDRTGVGEIVKSMLNVVINKCLMSRRQMDL